MKIVLAGSYREYRQWLRDNKMQERDAIYGDSYERLLGLYFSKSDVVRTGRHWLSPITDEMLLSRMKP